MARSSFAAVSAGPPGCFVLDGERYELRGSWLPLLDHLPAPGWRIPLLFDLLHAEDADALDERLVDDDDPLTLTVLESIVSRLVEAATGRKPWVAEQLVTWAVAAWDEVDGVVTLRGVDLLGLVDTAPRRACNVLYALLLEGRDEKERAKLDSRLSMPPPGEDLAAVPLWDAEEEGAAFMAAYTAHQQK